jgi:hypothetical protein
MANQEQVERLKAGVDGWNKWRKENPEEKIDLSEADLNGTDLRRANLKSASLIFADLSNAELVQADLSQADLSAVNLYDVDLMEANLSEANLSNALLDRTNLRATKVDKTNFYKAETSSTILTWIDLSKARELDKIEHFHPSSIGTDTLVLSKGKIPDIFLRGCGLSDWEIEEAKLYNPELKPSEVNKILYRMYDLRATQAIQINPLFISYSHADGIFVDEMEVHLNMNGIRFWRDIHDAPSGPLEEIVDRAMRLNPTVLLVFSERSIESDWVEHEAESARELEKQLGRHVLCPISLDDAWKTCQWEKRLRRQIMKYNILDFSKWKDNQEFEKMFRRLIEGLDIFYKKV